MPRKEFESFTRLDASDVNTFLMDQSVQTFAGTAARGSAIATPVEGMVTYLNDIDSLSVYNGTAFTTDRTIQVFAGTAARGSAIGTAVEGMYTHINETDSLEYYNGSAWESVGGGAASAILQVVQGVKADTFETTASTYQAVTGLSATITCSSTASKVLVTTSVPFHVGEGGSIDRAGFLTVFRGATNLSNPTSPGDRTKAFHGQENHQGGRAIPAAAISFLDSPASTSALTYQVHLFGSIGERARVNYGSTDGDNSQSGRGVATITLMEVAG
jgi:hypothetical protein